MIRNAPGEAAKGHLAMILFATLIAGSFSLGARAAPHVGPAALNTVRFAIAVAVMGAVATIVTGRRPGLPAAPWRFLVLGACMGVYFVTMFMALRITDPVSTGAVFTLIPLMSALFGIVLLKEWPRPLVWVSLFIAAAGAVWVIFRGDPAALLSFRIGRGEAIFFVGCVGHALYAPLYRTFSRGEPLAHTTFHVLLATLAWIGLYGARETAATDWTGLPTIVWIAIFYLAIFTTAGTFFLLQYATLRLPAAKVLAYGYLTPTLIILWEAAGGGGLPAPSIAAGALMTVGGLAVMALEGRGRG